MKRKLKIYVAGPLNSSGIQLHNISRALRIANAIIELGHIPFIPHLYSFWDFINPMPEDYWLDLDHEWLDTCDACFRILGKSSGSDQEETWCKELNIPYYTSWDQFTQDLSEDKILPRWHIIDNKGL
jgi:hypothetical protein